MTRRRGALSGNHPDPKAKAVVEATPGEVPPWEEAHNTSQALVAPFSRTLHPVRISAAASQPSAQVASPIQALEDAMGV